MAETRNAFVTVCFPPEEIPLLEFAAKECGQTKSSFIYVLVRDRLRAMRLLPGPQLPPALSRRAENGKGTQSTTHQVLDRRQD